MKKLQIFTTVMSLILVLAANSTATSNHEIPPDREAMIAVKNVGPGIRTGITDLAGMYTGITSLVYKGMQGENAIIFISIPFENAALHFIECKVSRGEELPIEADWKLKIVDFNPEILKFSLSGKGKEFKVLMYPPGIGMYFDLKEKR